MTIKETIDLARFGDLIKWLDSEANKVPVYGIERNRAVRVLKANSENGYSIEVILEIPSSLATDQRLCDISQIFNGKKRFAIIA